MWQRGCLYLQTPGVAMTITTLSSRQFNQVASKARKAAEPRKVRALCGHVHNIKKSYYGYTVQVS